MAVRTEEAVTSQGGEGMTVSAPPTDVEYEISPELQQELLKHPGKWVAMTRTEIVAIGRSVGDVLLKAKAHGIDDPILYRVPRGQRALFF